VRFGLLLSCPPSVPLPERFTFIRQVAGRAEQAGLDFLVAGQHFADRDQQTMQPIPLLSALAPVVSLKLMTGVLLGPLLHPLAVAETFMTLDLISGGRTVLGVGAGHRAAEFDGFGVQEHERGARLEQFVLTVRRLWADKPDGSPISIPPTSWRRPPIWIAGSSDAGVRRAGRIGDAWYVGPGTPLSTLTSQLAMYRETVAANHRDLPAEQPIRRDVFVTTGRAKDTRAVLLRRYASQQKWGYASDLPSKVRKDRAQVLEGSASLESIVGEEVIAGSMEECADQLTRVRQVVGCETLTIVRAGWPASSGAQYLDEVDAVLELCSLVQTTGEDRKHGGA
jgi:alkanesulfonate monooxygenase SsuD/methylene tetrahydromethanopterin reductase-like flavin-dependent oxidoreductase (luciferase family)